MTLLDNTLNEVITNKIRKDHEEREHKTSGRLSASMLPWPTLWQILKVRGYEDDRIDDYTLRKFIRGNQIEEWFVKMTDAKLKQVKAEYRNAIGYIDFVMDDIPHEVKSVTNIKFRRITQQNGVDEAHKLQAGFYAIAISAPRYAIHYISSDDLRVRSYVFDTKDIIKDVDKIIDEFEEALKKEELPDFKPRYDWQSNLKYARYKKYMPKGGGIDESTNK